MVFDFLFGGNKDKKENTENRKENSIGFNERMRSIYTLEEEKAIVRDMRIGANNGDAKDQYELGCKYETGTLVINKDIQTAIMWYEKAADQGFQPAIDAMERIQKARL